jgi:addiction module RelB/DinJ family antitoxin
MGQSTFSIRLEDDIKDEMNSMCESIGMSMSTAFNIFARAFVRNGGFPFDVRLPDKRDPWDGFLEARRTLRERYPIEPGLDEIDEEIKAVRSSKQQ